MIPDCELNHIMVLVINASIIGAGGTISDTVIDVHSSIHFRVLQFLINTLFCCASLAKPLALRDLAHINAWQMVPQLPSASRLRGALNHALIWFPAKAAILLLHLSNQHFLQIRRMEGKCCDMLQHWLLVFVQLMGLTGQVISLADTVLYAHMLQCCA